MGELRQRFDLATHHLWSKAKLGDGCYVSDMVRIRGRINQVNIGQGVQLFDFCVLMAEAPLVIGQGCRIGYAAHVLAHAPVTLMANVRLGGHAQILSGYHGVDGWETGIVEIGTGSIIGPGAVVMPGCVVPAGTVLRPNEVFDASRTSTL